MAEATEVQYDQHGRSVVRVSDPLLAYEIAQELHDHKEATEYWVKAADQARLKVADLRDELRSLGEQTDDGKIADVEIARSLAVEVNSWRDKFTLAVSSHRSARAQAESFGEQARKLDAQLTDFKGKVREELIELEASGDVVDRDRLNEVLDTLGLERHIQKYKVKVIVTVLVEDPEVTDCDSAGYEAQNWVDNQISSNYDDTYVLDEVEYRDVDEIND